MTGLTIASNWSKIYLTVKTHAGDADSASVIQVMESVTGVGDGLLRLNGATASAAAGGALAVSQAGGTVAITLTDETTLQLVAGYGLAYDVKEIRADGESYALTQGEWNHVETPTKAIS